MRAQGIVLLLGLWAMPAPGACGGPAPLVRDWGLHRQWKVERDCAHPERPATLVAIPWTAAPEVAKRAESSAKESAARTDRPASSWSPWVRAGMQVVLWRQDGEGAIHLRGTAVEAGRAGESVLVRAGLDGATLRGVVRGPGLVELEPGKGGK